MFRAQADDPSGRLAPGAIWGPYPMRASHLRRGLADAWRDRLSALDGRRGARAALAVLRRAQTIDHAGQPLDALSSSAVGGRLPRLDALALADGRIDELSNEKGRWIDALTASATGAVAWSTGKHITARDSKGEIRTRDDGVRSTGLSPRGRGVLGRTLTLLSPSSSMAAGRAQGPCEL